MRGWFAYRPGAGAVLAHGGEPGIPGLPRALRPLGLRLEPLPAHLPELFRQNRDVPRSRMSDRRLMGWLASAPHQVGAPLYWPEERSFPHCPTCGGAPRELGMFFTDPAWGVGYGESGMIHLGLCPRDGAIVVLGR